MKVGSVSGFAVVVDDLDKTAKFYDQLGFRFGRREEGRLVVYVNWFSVEFLTSEKAEQMFLKNAIAENRDNNVYFLVSVSNVDEFYDEVKKAGYKTETEPTSQPTGRREFIMRDPDGYKLIFFTKK